MSNTITLPFKTGQIQSQGFGDTEFSRSPTGRLAYGYDSFGRARIHEGIDWYSNEDPTIYSIANGTVIIDNDSYNGSDSGLFASYGCHIVIKDDDSNRAWYYCHLDSNSVSYGQKVKQGQAIGIMGGSGYSTRSKFGTHLHLGRAELDSNNSRLNRDSISYGFIDGSDDLDKAIDQYNNQQSQTQTTQNTMSKFHIQSETELNKWVELYAESRLRELGVPVIKQIELHTKLVALNSKFNQNWILARFQLGSQDELVNMINEVYGWSIKEAEIKQSTNLQQITETDVKVSKYYRDLLDELNTVKAELNTYKISSPVVKNDKVIRYDIEVAQVKQEDKIKQLSTFTVFCKNNLTSFGTLITALGLGYKQIIEYIATQPYILYGLLAVVIISCIGAIALERIYRNKK